MGQQFTVVLADCFVAHRTRFAIACSTCVVVYAIVTTIFMLQVKEMSSELSDWDTCQDGGIKMDCLRKGNLTACQSNADFTLEGVTRWCGDRATKIAPPLTLMFARRLKRCRTPY